MHSKRYFYRVVLILMMLLLWGTMTACGGDEDDERAKDGNRRQREDVPTYEENRPTDEVVNNQPSPTNVVEPNNNPLPGRKGDGFEASPEWSQYSGKDLAVQIDDTIYRPGISVADFIAKVEASSEKYTILYSDGYEHRDKSVLDRETYNAYVIMIYVYKNDKLWFSAQAVNFFKDYKKVSELPIVSVNVDDKEAIKNAYILNGIACNDIIGMKYDEVKELFSTALSGRGFRFSEYPSSRMEGSTMELSFENDYGERIYMDWCKYSFMTGELYSITILDATGEVIDFKPQYRIKGFMYGAEPME